MCNAHVGVDWTLLLLYFLRCTQRCMYKWEHGTKSAGMPMSRGHYVVLGIAIVTAGLSLLCMGGWILYATQTQPIRPQGPDIGRGILNIITTLTVLAWLLCFVCWQFTPRSDQQ